MKQATRAACAAIVIMAGMGPGAWGQQRTIPIEGYAAKVNDRVIMVSEVMSLVRGAEERLPDALGDNERNRALRQAYEEALDTLIERSLILEEYEEREGQIPPQAIEDQMLKVRAEQFGNDQSRLLNALQLEHLSYDEWRQQVKEQLIISVMRREAVIDRISMSPNAVREAYEENPDYYAPAKVKFSTIMVHRGTTETEVRGNVARIMGARSRIVSGESFDLVAEDLSEGNMASDVGDGGWKLIRDLRPKLREMVIPLEPGELSRIVADGEYLYLVRVEERHEDNIIVPLEDVREFLEQEVRRAELRRVQDKWTERLRKKHFVQIYGPK